MNKQAELKKLKAVTKRIVENYDPEKIILFGSYAWVGDLFVKKIIKKGKVLYARKNWTTAESACKKASKIKKIVLAKIHG